MNSEDNNMNYEMTFTDELFHWGILGQKWGVRRYQNEDGTLTEAGKKRYGDLSDEERRKRNERTKAIEADIKQRNEAYSSMSNVAREGKNITTEAGSLIDRFGTKTYKKGPDASTMTDDELRQVINRLNMEQQYDRLRTETYTSKGAQAVKDIMSVAGSALVVAGSATAIIANMQKIMG